MNVRLEKYSVLKSPFQALDLYGLISEEESWVSSINPGAVERYRDYKHAVKNVARIAIHETVQAFVVRGKQAKAALGIATIIRNQSVIHPDLGKFTGHDLDYWLRQEADEDSHFHTGEGLIKAAKQLATRYNGEPANTNPLTMEGRTVTDVHAGLIVTTPTDGEAYNRGLHQAGQAVGLIQQGQPVQLEPGTAPDTYDIARAGHISQLYYGELGFTVR